jgi:SAM-dependent methyltransferase
MSLTNAVFSEINHFDAYKEIVKAHLPQSRRILDLGCGDNSILSGYRSADREIWGVDFAIHPNLRDAEWFSKLDDNGTIPFPDAAFDLVVCISVLEHVKDGHAFFREVARVLRPSGRFIGHSISGSHYVTWIRRAFGLLPHSFNQFTVKKLYGRDEFDTFPAFYRLNRQSKIDRAAQSAGLARTCLRRYPDQGYFSICPSLKPVATIVDGALAKISPSWGCLYFTVVLKKDFLGQDSMQT